MEALRKAQKTLIFIGLLERGKDLENAFTFIIKYPLWIGASEGVREIRNDEELTEWANEDMDFGDWEIREVTVPDERSN